MTVPGPAFVTAMVGQGDCFAGAVGTLQRRAVVVHGAEADLVSRAANVACKENPCRATGNYSEKSEKMRISGIGRFILYSNLPSWP